MYFNVSAEGIWMTNGVGQNVTLNGSGTLYSLGAQLTGLAASASWWITRVPILSPSMRRSRLRRTKLGATTRQMLLTVGAVQLSNRHAVGRRIRHDRNRRRQISGDGSLIKNGAGTLILSGSNTYDGMVTVVAGAVNIRNAGALGSTITAGHFGAERRSVAA